MSELDMLLNSLSTNKQELINIKEELETVKFKMNLLENKMNDILEEEKIFNNENHNLEDWLFSKTYLKGDDKETDRRSMISIFWRDPETETGFKEKLTKFDLLHLQHYKENRLIMERDLKTLNSRWQEYTKKKNQEENNRLDNNSINYNYIILNKAYELVPETSNAYQYVTKYIRLRSDFLSLNEQLENKLYEDQDLTEKILLLKQFQN